MMPTTSVLVSGEVRVYDIDYRALLEIGHDFKTYLLAYGGETRMKHSNNNHSRYSATDRRRQDSRESQTSGQNLPVL